MLCAYVQVIHLGGLSLVSTSPSRPFLIHSVKPEVPISVVKRRRTGRHGDRLQSAEMWSLGLTKSLEVPPP